MNTYTVRITEEEGHPVAWIDINGATCIKQPHAPGNLDPWTSIEDATAWANAHAQELTEINGQAEANAAAAAAQQSALMEQAQADSIKLAEIHEMLSRLTDNNA